MKSEQVKHTPGPWRIGQHAHRDGRPLGLETSVFSTEGQVKVAVIEWWGGSARQEAECNALLIAAAPELLEFAQMIANGGLDAANHETIEAEAREILTKAQHGSDDDFCDEEQTQGSFNRTV